ncbi:DsbA family oxidoreductase [Pseudooceanicola sp. 502str34]
MVKLDILSDPICPWCYFGATQLFRALSDRPDHPFTIEWHPFQLNAAMPAEGAPRAPYLSAKFGGEEALVSADARLNAYAAENNIPLDTVAMTKVPNTLNAHRLIHWAGLEGVQTPVVLALYRAYFAEGRDIGATEVLADIADHAGMDASVVLKLLESDADVEMISSRDAHSREMGVSSVPTFIVGQRHAVPGAQPAELWVKVIDELLAEAAQPEG